MPRVLLVWPTPSLAQPVRAHLLRGIGIHYVLILDSRFPFGNSLRLGLGLRVECRDQDGGPDAVVVTPGLRLEYRFGSFTSDVELAFDWVSNHRANDLADESGYRALLGIRYDL